jgi:3-hydroxyisobutyrate dehydrogenase-like beta-hydroxyacid dehydrogenase
LKAHEDRIHRPRDHGAPDGLNLLKGGHQVTVWARRAESMQPLLEPGATGAGSPAEAARSNELVISMVADAPDVAEVMRGVAQGAAPGLVAVDMSTIAPLPRADRRRTGRRRRRFHGCAGFRRRGRRHRRHAVDHGRRLESAFAGPNRLSSAWARTSCMSALPAPGRSPRPANQIVTGMGVLAVAEAFAFAAKNGVDRGKVREALLGGFAYSKILENHGQRMLDRNFKPGFKSWMHEKDLNIVMQTAHELGLCLPGSAATAQMFNAMVGSGMGEEDSIAVLKLLERLSGQE